MTNYDDVPNGDLSADPRTVLPAAPPKPLTPSDRDVIADVFRRGAPPVAPSLWRHLLDLVIRDLDGAA